MKKFELIIVCNEQQAMLAALSLHNIEEYSFKKDGETEMMVTFKCEPQVLFKLGMAFAEKRAAK